MKKNDLCEFCEGKVQQRIIRARFHFKGQTIYVDRVPTWVCCVFKGSLSRNKREELKLRLVKELGDATSKVLIQPACERHLLEQAVAMCARLYRLLVFDRSATARQAIGVMQGQCSVLGRKQE